MNATGTNNTILKNTFLNWGIVLYINMSHVPKPNV